MGMKEDVERRAHIDPRILGINIAKSNTEAFIKQHAMHDSLIAQPKGLLDGGFFDFLEEVAEADKSARFLLNNAGSAIPVIDISFNAHTENAEGERRTLAIYGDSYDHFPCFETSLTTSSPDGTKPVPGFHNPSLALTIMANPESMRENMLNLLAMSGFAEIKKPVEMKEELEKLSEPQDERFTRLLRVKEDYEAMSQLYQSDPKLKSRDFYGALIKGGLFEISAGLMNLHKKIEIDEEDTHPTKHGGRISLVWMHNGSDGSYDIEQLTLKGSLDEELQTAFVELTCVELTYVWRPDTGKYDGKNTVLHEDRFSLIQAIDNTVLSQRIALGLKSLAFTPDTRWLHI